MPLIRVKRCLHGAAQKRGKYEIRIDYRTWKVWTASL